jgi:RNA-directed DNA polymerase
VISKHIVKEAWVRVKNNKGSSGVDKETIEDFEARLKDNLYKIWNRMSSGSYTPPSVKLVEIEKKTGGKRPLGIPTVSDRVAQMVCKIYLEPAIDRIFHQDSYGYRPGKSAHQALRKCKERCLKHNWVIDLDIKGFFDNIDHELMMKAVRKHTEKKWILLYVERWLKAPLMTKDGEIKQRNKGTPQGGVISPLLANLFLHYALDKWLERNYPHITFERYADDCIIHCVTEKQTLYIKDMIEKRLKECKVELHPTKTKIVYCKDIRRKGTYKETAFDFLGYTFKARKVKWKDGRIVSGFVPAISKIAGKKIKEEMRSWKVRFWTGNTLEGIAKEVNSIIWGWINYYGAFYRRALRSIFFIFDKILVKWVMNKYKRYKNKWSKAYIWLRRIGIQNPMLFAHWHITVKRYKRFDTIRAV